MGSSPGTPPPGSDDLVFVSPRIRNGIAIVITSVWAVGILADAVLATFELSPFVYMTMLGLAAAIFGSGFVKGVK